MYIQKTNNYIKGRYLAELTREVVGDLEDSKYQYAEYRISIYGRYESEIAQEVQGEWCCKEFDVLIMRIIK